MFSTVTTVTGPDAEPGLAATAGMVLELLEFVAAELDVPTHGSFESYADRGPDPEAWEVVAVPEFSLPRSPGFGASCNLLTERHYFRRQGALAEASRLRARGLDVDVRPVHLLHRPQGATPLPSAVTGWNEFDVAYLIVREIAMQNLGGIDDPPLLCSAADVAAREGALRWTSRRGPALHQQAVRIERARADLQARLRLLRSRLEATYASQVSPAAKRAAKAETLAAIQSLLREAEPETVEGRLDLARLVHADLNNAHLAAVGGGPAHLGLLENVIERHRGSVRDFLGEVRALARLPAADRVAALRAAASSR